MVKILISNATILTMSSVSKLVIGRGYVYVRDGVIESIGPGEPPDEFRYPELLINGDGRLVVPGFSSAITTITLYPLRYRVRDIDWSKYMDYISVLTRTDVYYLAILAFTEMISSGVTTALIVDVFSESIARAARDVGFYVNISIPYNIGIKDFDPDHELKLVINRWGKVPNIKASVMYFGVPSRDWVERMVSSGVKVYIHSNELPNEVLKYRPILINPRFSSELPTIRYGYGLNLWRPNEGLGIGVRPSYNIVDVLRELRFRTSTHELDLIASATITNNELIGFSRLGSIDVGSIANIVMFDTSVPPGWPIPIDIESICRAIVEGRLVIETVILGDEVLMDNKETLTIGYDLLKKALRRLDPTLRRFLNLPQSLQ